MIAVLSQNASLAQKAGVIRLVEDHGLGVHVTHTPGHCLIGLLGEVPESLAHAVRQLDGVVELDREAPPYLRVSRAQRPLDTVIQVGAAAFGGEAVQIIAGPCSVESTEQLDAIAPVVAASGCAALRGGAYKPRTSPYAFQGLGPPALEMLAQARAKTGLPVVTEVLDVRDVERVAAAADVLQVGARNMQNVPLLRELGRVDRPVLLKRGMAASLDELLCAAEYVVGAGNPRVMLCERGVRTHVSHARATLDLAAIPVLRARTHLPVLVDPSHAAGRRELVAPLALAAIAAGADGLLLEAHPNPAVARSDKAQQLTPDALTALVSQVRAVASALGRSFGPLAAVA